MERKPIYQALVSIEPFKVKEFKDFQSAKKVDSLAIIKKTFKRIHVTYSGNEYEIYNYSFLNIVEDLTKAFVIDGWSIEDVYDGYFSQIDNKWSTWNTYTISDKTGELRKQAYDSPEEAIKNLLIFSKFKNWSEYELANPLISDH